MEGNLEYEINNGVRYVVIYTGSDKENIYFTDLHTEIEDAEVVANKLVKDLPAIADKLTVTKVKPVGPVDISQGLSEVMIWTKNPRFFNLEKIYEIPGKARISIEGLENEVMISIFSKEVVRTYKNESRA